MSLASPWIGLGLAKVVVGLKVVTSMGTGQAKPCMAELHHALTHSGSNVLSRQSQPYEIRAYAPVTRLTTMLCRRWSRAGLMLINRLGSALTWRQHKKAPVCRAWISEPGGTILSSASKKLLKPCSNEDLASTRSMLYYMVNR